MLWLIFVLLAAIFWTCVDLVDKFVIDKEIESPILAAGIFGVSTSSFIALISVFFAEIFISPTILLVSFFAGILYRVAAYFYYSGMQREEVSRFTPTLSLTTVFIVILGFLFLGERFSMPVYLGIGLTVGGAILISLENPIESLKEMKSESGFLLTAIAAFFYASRDVAFKFATNMEAMMACIFWMSVGGIITSTFFLLKENERIRSRELKGIKHLLVLGLIGALGYFSFAAAISMGPVSLASAVLKVEAFLVFFSVTMITKFHPKIFHEEIDRFTLFQKLSATGIIVAGVIIIQLFS
ncbi:MAG: GRP family sugar transporter [Candidatus Aenigmatarchaeota archaeon]